MCTWISWYWNKWEDMSGCGWQGLALRQLSCMNVSTEAFFFCVLVCSIPFRALIWKPDYINANSHTLPGSGKVLMVPHFDSLISLDSFRFHSLHLSACHHTNGLYLMTVWNTPQISVFSLKSSTKPIIYNLHCLIVQVSLASNSLPLLVYCLSWLVCPLKCGCVCPVRHPAPVLSLFCRQEKAEEC